MDNIVVFALLAIVFKLYLLYVVLTCARSKGKFLLIIAAAIVKAALIAVVTLIMCINDVTYIDNMYEVSAALRLQ